MKNDTTAEITQFVRDLFPICRSITGKGVRDTLARMSEEIPLIVNEITTGTKVFDWTVPDEWNIKGAWIDDPDGRRIVDFRDNNLHVMSYSIPVNVKMDLEQLRPHLHTLPEQPEWIPYRTSYYHRDWGFCLSHSQLQDLQPGSYQVHIDSELTKGSLTLGELLIPGQTADEILVWSHLCHPSLCNDNLSGLAVSVWWAKHLMKASPGRYSYRFVWGPGTIGSIAWLATNQAKLDRIKHGLVTVLLGRPGPFHYKQTRNGDAMIDRIVHRLLKGRGDDFEIRDFDPYGYDERQFGSPGVDLPVGRLTRTPNGEYAEYHTSADDPGLISGEALAAALELCVQIGQSLDDMVVYRNLQPRCEPQLGRRGLYGKTGGKKPKEREYAMLWILNQSDGHHSLSDIAERSGLSENLLQSVAADLEKAGLLQKF